MTVTSKLNRQLFVKSTTRLETTRRKSRFSFIDFQIVGGGGASGQSGECDGNPIDFFFFRFATQK